MNCHSCPVCLATDAVAWIAFSGSVKSAWHYARPCIGLVLALVVGPALFLWWCFLLVFGCAVLLGNDVMDRIGARP